MKRIITSLFTLAAVCVAIFTNVDLVQSFSGNAPDVLADIVNDGNLSSCNSCHGGATTGIMDETGGINLEISQNDKYNTDSIYDLKVIVNNLKKRHGFQMIALDKDLKSVGTFTSTGALTKVEDDAKYSISHISHSNIPGTSGGEFSFKWEAPSSDIGEITFHCIAVAADGDNKTTNDSVYYVTHKINYNPPVSVGEIVKTNIDVYPTISSGELFFNASNEQAISRIDFYNMNGAKAYSANNLNQINVTVNLKDQGLLQGWYLVNIKQGNNSSYARVYLAE